MMNYTFEDKAYLWLTLADRTSLGRRNNILKLESSVETLFKTVETHRETIVRAHGEEYYSNLIKYRDLDLINDFIDENNKRNILILTPANENYPDSLRNIDAPPTALFCLGDSSLLKSRAIAVVGTRSITRYGVDVTENFTKEFVSVGLTVVSGLANGVDSVAHRTVLSEGGKTVAVSPAGLDKVYPAVNRDLFNQIAEKGLVVSEYVFGTGVKQYTFVERNRLISGLAEAVFIPEAGFPSGSLITANDAIEQGKDLFVVPGNIYGKYSAGCNKLIKDLQGAMVTEPKDVLNALGFDSDLQPKKETQLTIEEASIINLLEKEDLHFETLLNKVGLSVKELNAILLKLELLGIIKRLPGNYFGL